MHFENFGSRRRRCVSCYCSCCCWLLLGRVCLAGGESKVSEWREINSLRLLRKQPGGWECSRCNQRSTPQRYIYLFYLILWLWRRLWPMSHGLSSVCRAEFVRSSSMHSPRRPFDIENSCVKRSFVLRFFISFSFARRETESSSSSSFCPCSLREKMMEIDPISTTASEKRLFRSFSLLAKKIKHHLYLFA